MHELVIGLEIHMQLDTKSKLFCGCSADSRDQEPNSNICPVCSGQPGSLPMLNSSALAKGLSFAKALNCDISELTYFDRKHYFYRDLPKGYQISQYRKPLGVNGSVLVSPEIGDEFEVKIWRVHLEEDAGKSVFSNGEWLIDLNRCGLPLVEVVTGPNLRSSDQAISFIQHLSHLARWHHFSNCEMAWGQLRFDVNVSLRKMGTKELNQKVEIKNLNSYSSLRSAIEAEYARQREMLDERIPVESWTLEWDQETSTLRRLRSKEGEKDYRYFPDPDLPPVKSEEVIREKSPDFLNDSPQSRSKELVEKYHLGSYEAGVITSEREYWEYFDAVIREKQLEPTLVAKWIINDVFSLSNEYGKNLFDLRLSPKRLAKTMKLLMDNTITHSTAKALISKIESEDRDPFEILNTDKRFRSIDGEIVRNLCVEAISRFPEQVNEYRNGNEKIISWLVGQVIEMSEGIVEPSIVRNTLIGLAKENKDDKSN